MSDEQILQEECLQHRMRHSLNEVVSHSHCSQQVTGGRE